MSREIEYATFQNVTVDSESKDAILVVIDQKKYWVPKSLLSEDSEVYEFGTDGKFIVQQWWAEKNGLV